MLKHKTIEGLRESNRKDLEAARLLDCAASYVERGWAQCSDAVSGTGAKVPAWSKRATCWCALGAIRAAQVRLGMVTLYSDAEGRHLHCRGMTPFVALVYARATWAAARAMTGREEIPVGMPPSVITRWNDTEAMSGETVARKLREAAGWVRLRIETVQRGIRAAEGGQDA